MPLSQNYLFILAARNWPLDILGVLQGVLRGVRGPLRL